MMQVGMMNASDIDGRRLDAVMLSGLGRVFPAACLLVLQDGRALFQRSYGYLDPRQPRFPTQLDSYFDLASLTKLFTWTAFMRLVETGRVALADPLVAVIPEFAGVRPIGPAEEPLSKTCLPALTEYLGQRVDASHITFRHLLTHTAGLPAWRSVYLAAGDGTVGQRWRNALQAICGWDFFYPPGARIVYSDVGFMLLGEAITRLMGQPLEVCLQQAVFEPLGLTHTGYRPVRGITLDVGRGHVGILRGSDSDGAALEPLFAPTEECPVRRYRLLGEVDDENCAGLGGIAGHAGLFSTAADVATLCEVYRDPAAGLLKSETVAETIRQQAAWQGQRRGLGWRLFAPDAPCGPAFGPRAFGHTGFTGTSAWIDPDRRLVVVLLTNRVYYGRGALEIGDFRPLVHTAVIRALEEAG